MQWNHVLAVIVSLLALSSLLTDLGRARVEKMPVVVSVPQHLEADPNLKLVSQTSPFMRSERLKSVCNQLTQASLAS